MKWSVIDSGAMFPADIMAKDSQLLAGCDPEGSCLLHFYEWSVPSLTYGYFISPEHYLCMDALKRLGIHAARRPTGGGIIFHLFDLAFSLIVPNVHPLLSTTTLDNYRWINRLVSAAVVQSSSGRVTPQLLQSEIVEADGSDARRKFCMAKPTVFDLLVDGKKVGGAAQRRGKNGLLHQGSLSLIAPDAEILRQVLKSGEGVVQGMLENTYSLLEGREESLDGAKQALKAALVTSFSE